MVIDDPSFGANVWDLELISLSSVMKLDETGTDGFGFGDKLSNVNILFEPVV